MAEERYEDIYRKQFSFGRNWTRLLRKIEDSDSYDRRIKVIKSTMLKFTKLPDFSGKTFMDIGCGIGLFSLAAYQLGATKVLSTDVDRASLDCTRKIKKKFARDAKNWRIINASILDNKWLKNQDKCNIVYSYGVLHHTGDMWTSLDNAAKLVNKNGFLYIAIYNKYKGLPFSSEQWNKIKGFYSRRNFIIRKIMEVGYITGYTLGLILTGNNPISYFRKYKSNDRGMNLFVDATDWLGGFPYEFASVKEITSFHKERGFRLVNKKLTNREGLNIYFFQRI